VQDSRRRTYNVKEARIAKLYAEVLKVEPSTFGMVVFKNKAVVGEAAGDFGMAAERALQDRTRVRDPRPKSDPGPTVGQVNDWLTELSLAENDAQQKAVILALVQSMTPMEQRWLLRVLLKDLKARIRHEGFFAEMHPDAQEVFNSRNDLEFLCSSDSFRSPKSVDGSGILLNTAFHPMLCARISSLGGIGREVHKCMSPGGRFTEFVVEEKLDGERLLVHKDGSSVRLFTRRTNEYTSHYSPSLAKALVAGIQAERAIIDGEVLAYDPSTGQFLRFGENRTVASEESASSTSARSLCFVAFDILWVEKPRVSISQEGDVTRFPLGDRKRLLELVIPEPSRVMGKLQVLEYERVSSGLSERQRSDLVEQRLARAMDGGGEGIVVKSWASPYVCNARDKAMWIKVKPEYIDGSYDTLDVVVVGGYIGEGRSGRVRAGQVSHFALAVADRSPAEGEAGPTAPVAAHWKTIGKVGTGYSFAELGAIRSRLQPHWVEISADVDDVGSKAPYMADWKPPAKDRPDFVIDDVRNSILVEVRAPELTRAPIRSRITYSAGVALRFPRVVRFRPDKAVSEAATMSDINRIMRDSQGKLQRQGVRVEGIDEVVKRATKRARSPSKAARDSVRARLAGEFDEWANRARCIVSQWDSS
jgi:DNA ligase 4